MNATSSTRNWTLRSVFATVSIYILLLILFVTLYSWFTTSVSEGIPEKPFNDIINESIKIRIDLCSNLFQLTLIIIGALWGLVIAKENEAGIVLEDRQEIIMFVCASLLLLSALTSHIMYSYRVSDIYGFAGQHFHQENPVIGDVFNPIINNFFVYQILHLAFGFIVAIGTLFSAHKLK